MACRGCGWAWNLPSAGYSKLQGSDTRELTRELREHGIRVQGSTIIGLEHHTPDNIIAEIEHAVSHDTDFHQFMLYTPVPGTPLYQQMSDEGRLLRDVDYADVHGQFKFNFKHAAISREDSKRFLDWAFWRDFELNGPSLYRISRTLLAGWKRYKDCPDARVRERFAQRNGTAQRHLQLGPVGNGASIQESRSQCQRADRRAAPGIQAGVGNRIAHDAGSAGPGLVVDDAPRRATPGARQDLRAANDSGTEQLGRSLKGGLAKLPGMAMLTIPCGGSRADSESPADPGGYAESPPRSCVGNGIALCVLSDLVSARRCWRAPEIVKPCS